AVAYALTTKAQSAGITSVAHAIASLSPAETRDLPLGLFTAWGERVRFVLFNVVTLLVGAFALTRERTKSFFAAVARATERAEEEP
ncbi:MAG TPA: hypothetical protein VHB21_01195, partial [Minicystis sp.]|nr:hypothetical protein [Minicystis sp.]